MSKEVGLLRSDKLLFSLYKHVASEGLIIETSFKLF